MHYTFNSVTVLALLLTSTVLSQPLNSNIIGCAAIPCPEDSTDNSKCTVIDKTFPSTEGVSINSANGKRTFEKTFYFGTPPKTNLTGTGACAVFFSQVSKNIAFPNSNIEEAQGTCQETMNAQCVSALVARAEKVDVAGLGSVEACAKLESTFKETVDSACVGFADGNTWTGVSVKPLTGSDAADPITASQNSTSNCWPIVPKEYDLALVTSLQTAGDFPIDTASANFFGIVPILTLFYPGNGTLITKAEAQLTCMKTVGPSASQNATKSGTDKNEDKGSA
ncbi:hypothetical protein BKA61DRAFT_652152 [Leptodontidium sp. MPI-SDFR-AT-0119]|nr:hypothetical protein BKA61DRAFT_652152 [Leptodontidium sp. MPI-SDFR-AT-0119]